MSTRRKHLTMTRFMMSTSDRHLGMTDQADVGESPYEQIEELYRCLRHEVEDITVCRLLGSYSCARVKPFGLVKV